MVERTEGRAFEACAFRLVERTRAQVVRPDGAPRVSTAPSSWQASARMVHQFETYLRGLGSELRNFDVSTYEEDVGVWRLPA